MPKEFLPVKLTETELREYGQTAAKRIHELAAKRGEAKSVAANFKAEITDIEEDIQRLSECINDECERRMVEVRTRIDRAAGTATTYRTDTGEIVSTRALTADEMQMTLDALTAPDDEPNVVAELIADGVTFEHRPAIVSRRDSDDYPDLAGNRPDDEQPDDDVYPDDGGDA